MTGRAALRPVTQRRPHVAPVQRRTPDLNGRLSARTVTKRPDVLLNRPDTPIAQRLCPRCTDQTHCRTDRTPQCQHLIDSSKHPLTIRHVRSIVTGRATASDRPFAFAIPLAPDRTRRSREWPNALVQNPSDPHLTAAATDRTRSVKPWPRLVQRPVTLVTSVRLRFFTESCLVSSAGGRGSLHTSPPLKRHLLCKCDNTTKCTSLCVCMLAFSQSF
jgi:hypothetical protein